MSRIVFLIGHPASGKSTLYSLVNTMLSNLELTSYRMNDREFFLKVLADDTEHNYHLVKHDGTIKVTDHRFYELCFALLSKTLRETQWREDWIFVELTSSDYEMVTQQLGPDFLKDCYLILVLAPLETLIDRNRERSPNTEDIDQIRIPEDYLIDCYNQDFNLNSLSPLFRKSIVVQNDSENLSFAAQLASQVTDFLLRS